MVCSKQSHVLAKSCSLIAVTMLVSLMTAETPAAFGAKASPGQKGIRKHHTISPLPPESPPLPVPIPRMTMDELPTQTPRVTYSTVMLTLDSDNTTLSEALSAIRDTTSLQIEPLPESTERFSAHFSGSPREVIAHLLEGSGFGYVLVASRDDPAKLEKLILTKRVAPTPSYATKDGAANSPRAVPPRLAPYIPPESVAERRGANTLDTNLTPPSADEAVRAAAQTLPLPPSPTAALPDDTSSPTAPPDASAPANATLTQPAGADSRKQVNAAGQYMQELYRMRLQQQTHQPGPPAATPP